MVDDLEDLRGIDLLVVQRGTNRLRIDFDQLRTLVIVSLENHMARLNLFMGCYLVELRCNPCRLLHFFALLVHPKGANNDRLAANWKHRSFFTFLPLFFLIFTYF